MARWRPLAVDDLPGPAGGDRWAAVLLHGQPGSRQDWAKVAALLAGELRVLVPDRPGYGATGGRPLGFAGNAEAVLGLLDRLGIERVVAVGHSWGAGVALALAARHPQRVAGLVLAAPVGAQAAVTRLDRAVALPLAGAAVAALTFKTVGRLLLVRGVRRRLAELRPATSEAWLESTGRAWSGRVWRSWLYEQRALVAETPPLWSRTRQR